MMTTRNWLLNPVSLVIWAVVTLFILSGIFGSFYTVKDGMVGVVSTFGKYNDNEAQPGWHWKMPFVQTVDFKDVRMKTVNYIGQQETGDDEAGLSGRPRISILDVKNLPIGIDLTIQYTPDKESMSDILRTYGHNYFEKKLNPIVRAVTRDVASKYEAENIAKERENIGRQITVELSKEFEKLPFELNQVALRNIVLPEIVARKIKEVQEAKQEEQRLEMAEKQAVVNKRIEIINAQRQAEVKIEQARGIAESIKVRSIEQANANKRVAASLTPLLVKQNQIEQWNGTVPHLMPGGQEGFLFQLTSGHVK